MTPSTGPKVVGRGGAGRGGAGSKPRGMYRGNDRGLKVIRRSLKELTILLTEILGASKYGVGRVLSIFYQKKRDILTPKRTVNVIRSHNP